MSQFVTSDSYASPKVNGAAPDESSGISSDLPNANPVDSPTASVTTATAPVPPKSLQPCLTDEEKAKLNWKQIGVLENLAAGLSVSDAARLVQVSRTTIYNWLNDDPIIRAAYNRWKRLCEQSAEARLLSLQETALDVVAEQIVTKRDGRLALALLKSLRVLKPAEAGPTSPALVKQTFQTERMEQRINMADRALHAERGADIHSGYLVDEGEKEA